jgi:hypothetical protein
VGATNSCRQIGHRTVHPACRSSTSTGSPHDGQLVTWDTADAPAG